MEQALSDSQILSHIQLLSSEHLYTLKQIHSVDYERKLLGGDRHKARERSRQRQRASGFRVTACSHCSSETYVLHPSVPPSPRGFPNACANAAW